MVALVVGPEKVEATKEDGGARGTEVSRRRWSIETKAIEPSERPARRNLKKMKNLKYGCFGISKPVARGYSESLKGAVKLQRRDRLTVR